MCIRDRSKIKALILHKIGDVSVHQTDNIIVSAFVSTKMVGLLSNYNLIINTVSSCINVLFNSVIGSLGNMAAMESKDYQYKVFKKYRFIGFWFYGFTSIALAILMLSLIHILNLAAGEYITFVDSDDYICPQMYEEMLKCAKKNHCDLVMCDCMKVYSDGRQEMYSHNIRGGFYDEEQLHMEYYPHLLIMPSIEYPATISNCACMFKNIGQRMPRYKPGIRYSEDWLFGCCLLYTSVTVSDLAEHAAFSIVNSFTTSRNIGCNDSSSGSCRLQKYIAHTFMITWKNYTVCLCIIRFRIFLKSIKSYDSFFPVSYTHLDVYKRQPFYLSFLFAK